MWYDNLPPRWYYYIQFCGTDLWQWKVKQIRGDISDQFVDHIPTVASYSVRKTMTATGTMELLKFNDLKASSSQRSNARYRYHLQSLLLAPTAFCTTFPRATSSSAPTQTRTGAPLGLSVRCLLRCRVHLFEFDRTMQNKPARLRTTLNFANKLNGMFAFLLNTTIVNTFCHLLEIPGTISIGVYFSSGTWQSDTAIFAKNQGKATLNP